MKTETCKNRECKKEFIQYKTRQKYCSKKCISREAYLRSMDTGWRTEQEKEVLTITCNHRKCKKPFKTTDKRKMYCSKNCAKYESKILRAEGYKSGYKSRVKPRDVTCEYRRCDNVFTATSYNAKYCCKKCSDAEHRARTYERKVAKNPPKRRNTKHVQILSKGKKAMEYINPNFSAEWLQERWDKVKHQYIKESR